MKVIGVRFRVAGKIYFFNPLQFPIKSGDHVIVETARGVEYGTVVGGIREIKDEEVSQPLNRYFVLLQMKTMKKRRLTA